VCIEAVQWPAGAARGLLGGTGGLGSVGPLLAVLMSMQQGWREVRSRAGSGLRAISRDIAAGPGFFRRFQRGTESRSRSRCTGHGLLPGLVPRAGTKIAELLTR